MRSKLFLASALGTLFLSVACAVNPATGGRELSLIGQGQEIEMGRAADKDVSASLGLVDDPALQAYVSGLGKGLAAVSDAYTAMSLQLQQAFGLRREESIKLRPVWADRSGVLHLKASWTKGGKERDIPIATDAQRALLHQAK